MLILLQNSLKKCPTDTRVYIVPLPPRIKSFLVKRNDFYTICVNECLSPEARMKAYEHELWHLEHDDLHSDLPTGLIEIRAHKEVD